MTPIDSRHAAAVKRIAQALSLSLGDRAIVSIQYLVRLDTHSELQPDIVLHRPRADFYAGAHPGPGDVLLLVEVADSTLRFDRDIKLPLYARHGIPEVWLVDIENAQFTIHHDPQPPGYSQVHTPPSLTRLEVPGISNVALELAGLF